MTRVTVIGAACALLMAGSAFAQDNPPAGGNAVPPPLPEAGSPPPAPEAAPPAVASDDGADVMVERGDGERRGWRHRHGGRHGWRGGRDSGGAVFRFSAGEDGPSFVVRCAASDTTQACVEAIMPMLERLVPGGEFESDR